MSALVLGGNISTFRALKPMGVPTVVVSAGKFTRLTELPERQRWHVPVEDHTSAECVMLALRGLPASVRIDSVYTQDEFALVTAAVIARVLGVPGPDLAVACTFRDKVLQKAALRAEEIAVADWHELDGDHEEKVAACDSFGYPVVIKPVSGSAAVDTYRMDGHEEADRIIRALYAARPGRRMMIERFLPDDERSINGVIVDGEITALGVERYTRPELTCRDGKGHGSVLEDPERAAVLYKRADAFVRTALGVLGLRTGPFHMEVFDGPSGFTYGECAARPPGGYIAPAMHWKTGIDLCVESFRLHVMGPAGYIPPSAERRAGGVAWADLACPPGLVEYVPSSRDILSLPDVVGGGVFIKAGDEAPDLAKSSARSAGYVLVEAADEDAAEERLVTICRDFTASCRVVSRDGR